jgi:transcriptional regulator with XRE-family HTH domain
MGGRGEEMKKRTNSAVEILHKRYIEGDPERKVEIQQERVSSEIARLIYDLRKSAGLTQKQLAEMVGTTQSVISRLEDADYEGHSFSMLERIAKTLNKQIKVSCAPEEHQPDSMRHILQILVKKLRLKHGLSLEDLAKKLDTSEEDVLALERNARYRPTPLMLFRLSKFFDVPQPSLNFLAGATKEIPPEFTAEASRFAAQSESFEKLTHEEKKILDAFVTFLKTEFQGG